MKKFPIEGRIESAKSVNGYIQTILVTPAPDAYSKPQSFLMRSQYQLGQPGAEVKLLAQMTGYVRKKSFTNKTTHMQDEFWEANVFFDAELAPVQTTSSPAAQRAG